MRDLSSTEIQVPVSNLMCSDVRMSSLLLEDRPIHRREMPLFLSLLDEVVDRWYTAVGRMNPEIYDRYKQHSDIVTEMRMCFDRILEDDTSSVFTTRSELSELLGQFDEMMNNFAEVFSYPMELREFYYNISSRLKLTTDSMWEGTYGW